MGFFKMASSSYPAALNRINQQPPQQQQQQQQQQQSRPTPATTANPPHPPYQRATIISDCALVPSPVATTTAAVVPPPPSYHTPPSSSIVGVVRVPVPNGMSPGERIRVRLPDGTEVVHAIPHTSEWQYDGGGRTVPYFRIRYGGEGYGANTPHVPLVSYPHATTTTTTTTTMRVPIPDGMQPGQHIRVRSPDGNREWSYDCGPRPYFRVGFGGVGVVGGGGGGTAIAAATTTMAFSPQSSSSSSYPPATEYNPYENPMNGPTTIGVGGGGIAAATTMAAAAAVPSPSSYPPATEYNPYENPMNGPTTIGVGGGGIAAATTMAAAAAAAVPPPSSYPPATEYNPYENPMNGPMTNPSSFGTTMAGVVDAPLVTNVPPPPYSTEWRHYRVTAPSHYDPPPVGVRSVPCIPRGVYSSHLPPNGRHKALLVGINYEGTRARLRGCVNDAKCMMNLLRRNGYPDDGSHMLLLSDERSRGMEYQPTTENILKALKWFMKDVRRGDVLFFHFSGHGGQVPDKGGHEADGYNETIVPVDFQSKGQITDDVLWGSLVYDLPEGSRLTALMDMCHSGTGLDLPFDYDLRTRRWREDINPAHSSGDVVLFSGCEDSQTSADVGGGYGKMAGGAMTQAFTSAYEQTAALSTYHDFLEALRRQLKSKGFKQRPQLTSSQMFEAESRIFSLGCQASLSGGLPSYIEPNHNATIGRDKRRHIRPARQGFGVGGRNDIFGMAGGIIAGAIIADMLF
ncbi:hypothetical protein ACHAXA_002650 [Cyclostephanos tholiformis]|uniref:Peptidase C14 caspase domain-containing protein n=1 Tax=Cyclostephanos tholiformis TaxID=382380 RepID=A0ABD3SCS6_9STRA